MSVVFSFVVVWLLTHVQLFCDPMDYSPPGFSVHGILQVRILEWLAISSPGNLPDFGIEPESPSLAGGFLTVCGPCQMSIPFLPSRSCHEFLPDISEEADLSAAPGGP